MRLTKTVIEGFRSFGERQIIEFDNMTVFIGENSSGKTAALAALRKIFAPKQSDRQLLRSDFHLPKGMKPEEVNELKMTIEAVLEFDELNTKEPNDAVAIFYDYLTINEAGKTPIVRIRLSATWSRSANAEGSIDSNISFIVAGENSPETEENRIPARRIVLDAIRMIYIPAARDPKAELKPSSGTIMNNLIKSVNWDDQKRETISELIGNISNSVLEEPGTKAIAESLHESWNTLDNDDRYGNARLVFGGGDFESVISHPSVTFSPTPEEREYSVEELGDGLRSLFYFSMVKSIIELEDKIRINSTNLDKHFEMPLPALTLLAIEEPENHIAPHLLGKLMAVINEIGGKPHCQIIATSHSPAIVKRIEPREIRHFRIHQETRSSICRQLILPSDSDPESLKYVRGSLLAYPEVLFARCVILGEGSSEEIILPRVINQLYGPTDSIGVSVAPLGGRHVNHFWRLLSELEIPYVTILDFDQERTGGGWGRIKYAATMLNDYNRNRQIDWPSGISAESPEFNNLAKRDYNDPELKDWIEFLESEGIFFSNPLDIDFEMLSAFPNQYIAIANKDTSNTKTKPESNTTEKLISDAIEYVLHGGQYGSGGNGSTYSDSHKKLMPYYKKLFLGKRGKPSTHILALADIDDTTFEKQMPKVLARLAQKVFEQVSMPSTGAINES